MFVCRHWKLFDKLLFLTLQTMSQKRQKTLSKQLLGPSRALVFVLNILMHKKMRQVIRKTICMFYFMVMYIEKQLLVLFTILVISDTR